MAFETVLGDLQREDLIDANKILESLLNPKNIDMKTHIISPVTFAILESVVNNLEKLLTEVTAQRQIRLPLTKKLLEDLILKLKLFLVSWNRQSRVEVTKTLQSIRQEGSSERSFFQKLLGTGK